ncbi:MAG: polysaccharide deacetylase family protein [Alphaproteobacteria bacterium]
MVSKDTPAMPSEEQDTGSSAVILAYSRIDEDSFTQTSLRLSDFEAHLEELKSGGYNIMSLLDVIKALKENAPLPEKTVALTFEGGYKSAFTRAMPLLLDHNIPFTVFYASNNAEMDTGEYMNWEDLKSLQRYKNVSLGILPSSYQRVTNNSKSENKRYLNNAKIAYRKHFKDEATLASYPFGQHNESYKTLIKNSGIEAAFGLQSGVAYSGMDFMNIPRFPMTDGYGDLQRFRMVANALPIPAKDIEPADHVLTSSTPLFGFSVDNDSAHLLKATTCFIAGQGQAQTFLAGDNRLEIRPAHPLDDSRVRINCTATSGSAEEPKLHWLGMLYTLAEPLSLQD